jgi:hypothetical protein
MIANPTGAILGVQMSSLWIPMERLSKSYCLLLILLHALALKLTVPPRYVGIIQLLFLLKHLYSVG